mmetsp:Transcript_32363/g.89435  ORF Transcript_32363/g.89435 Transcript_32363/m.89435 type:complete len:157 (+) Transcript_32363:71-541(+)|eukprot:CAMPEP_0117525678 /NCGR_PEP_ID=MMETSP0784-20121206/35895_1 /TAXON_ID=39447 /ORGANISM="" /LENGTH=156 /DNA_ID=CAMNT_0005321885 /DNA_START=70 /DNA_END=540 /DNA_ORIENTATION=-
MGVAGSKCCSGQDNASTAHEQNEVASSKTEKAGEVAIPMPMPPQARQPSQGAAPNAPQPERGSSAASNEKEFEIVVDKTSGTKLGIDVDHQDGATLLIEEITRGLIESWNAEAPADRIVQTGDRVVEVNGLRNDVLMLVDECGKNQVLTMKVRRAK